jgi:hypothetical protein
MNKPPLMILSIVLSFALFFAYESTNAIFGQNQSSSSTSTNNGNKTSQNETNSSKQNQTQSQNNTSQSGQGQTNLVKQIQKQYNINLANTTGRSEGH